MPARGAFIVLEGIDHSGKSTQCQLLHSALGTSNERVELIAFPNRTTRIGGIIDGYLKNSIEYDPRIAHLLFSANRWEFNAHIAGQLQRGVTIIADRYAHSGVAYGMAGGLEKRWLQLADSGLVAPDLVIFLDAEVEVCASRGGYGKERYEQVKFQKEVRDSFRGIRTAGWKTVDASLPQGQVHEIALAAAKDAIMQCRSQSIARLWIGPMSR